MDVVRHYRDREERPRAVRRGLPELPEKVTYKLGPDSLKQDGVPVGELVGPTVLKSEVFDGTVRQVWVYVPAQYKPETDRKSTRLNSSH